MNFPILTAIVLTPVAGLLVILALPEREQLLIKISAAVAMAVSLAMSVYVFFAYDKALGGLQFLQEIPWVTRFGIKYSVGVDGISAPMVLLTAIVIFAGVFASWDMTKRVKEFFIFLLLLVSGVFGVFVSRDLFIFYLFFEIAVVPMYVLIGIWGSTRKEYAAMKLTLYLLIGSAFALIGIIALFVYAQGQLGYSTFDIQTLASVHYDVGFQKMIFFLFMIGFGVLVPM
ncbi:MAG: complex I subunit 4 family protein, partial [Bacillota bacterium]